MKVFNLRIIFTVLSLAVVTLLVNAGNNEMPRLETNSAINQLFVNGKPFLMLGGELGNSSAASTAELQQIFPKLRSMGLNTVLVPAYWELIEKSEGAYDYFLIDEAINQARKNNLKIVFLWFGAWKNSMSCYTPEWIKKDYARFPRTLDKAGKPSEIVSVFSENTLTSDIKVFSALLSHIKSIDAERQTVIMIQVENEIGQLPEARDYSSGANKAFQVEVPRKLMDYLTKNKSILLPHVKDLWEKKGTKLTGNWETIFGKSLATDELFTAWYYAVYADKMAEAGKAVYNLPMYVNCALNRPNVEPGKYPSGGPLPHLMNVWQAAALHIDMLSPDVYHGDFRNWCAQYDKLNNPLFIPEIKMEPENAAQVFYVFGRHKALGYSPFAIEMASVEENEPLRKSYQLLDDLSDIMLTNRSKTNGVYLDKEHKADTLLIGDYQVVIAHVCTLPWTDGAKAEKWTPAGCVIVETAPGEFWIGGTSVVCTFRNVKDKELTTGILSADVGTKTETGWHFKRLNGDQTHQGRHMRMGSGEWQIQRVRLYNYK